MPLEQIQVEAAKAAEGIKAGLDAYSTSTVKPKDMRQTFAPVYSVGEDGNVGLVSPSIDAQGNPVAKPYEMPGGVNPIKETPAQDRAGKLKLEIDKITRSSLPAAQKAKLIEQKKLEARLEGEPAVTTANKRAEAGVKSEVEAAERTRLNNITYTAWENGITELGRALGQTNTGPGLGWLPAISENQQKADQALASMAPLLKEVFRQAGEGTFTKDDQQILLDMLPDRGSHSGVIQYAINNINNIVRTKLGIQQPNKGGASPAPAMTDEDYQQRKQRLLGQ
jgi:hypothetical protein